MSRQRNALRPDSLEGCVSRRFTSRMSTWGDGVAEGNPSRPQRACWLIYAESDTISCFVFFSSLLPLRIQPCADVGHGPHYRNTFTVRQYRALHLFVYVYSMLLNSVKSLKRIDCGKPLKSGSFINWSQEKSHQAMKSFCAFRLLMWSS